MVTGELELFWKGMLAADDDEEKEEADICLDELSKIEEGNSMLLLLIRDIFSLSLSLSSILNVSRKKEAVLKSDFSATVNRSNNNFHQRFWEFGSHVPFQYIFFVQVALCKTIILWFIKHIQYEGYFYKM